eukprot:350576-Chlamydomonas_euryale.AAC.4
MTPNSTSWRGADPAMDEPNTRTKLHDADGALRGLPAAEVSYVHAGRALCKQYFAHVTVIWTNGRPSITGGFHIHTNALQSTLS